MIDWKVLKSQSRKNPKKLLRSVVLLTVVFFGIWLLAVSNTDTEPRYVKVNSAHIFSDSAATGIKPAGDSIIATKKIEFVRSSQNRENAASRTSFLWPSLFFLAIVLFGFVVWAKRKKAVPRKKAAIEVTESHPLEGGQHISLVRVNGEYLLLGSSPSGISLLKTYVQDERLKQDRSSSPQNEDSPAFLNMLNGHKKSLN